MTQDKFDKTEADPFKAYQPPHEGEVLEESKIEPRLIRRITRLEQTIEHYKGPLPPPDILIEYERIVPGSARQIIDVFLMQADHRMELEKTVIKGDSNRAYLGLGSAFVISLVVIGLSYVLISGGYGIAGALLGAFDLVALAGVFVYGTNKRRKERIDKDVAIKEKTES